MPKFLNTTGSSILGYAEEEFEVGELERRMTPLRLRSRSGGWIFSPLFRSIRERRTC